MGLQGIGVKNIVYRDLSSNELECSTLKSLVLSYRFCSFYFIGALDEKRGEGGGLQH